MMGHFKRIFYVPSKHSNTFKEVISLKKFPEKFPYDKYMMTT